MGPSPKPIPLRFWRSAAGKEPVRQWLNDLIRDDQRIVGRDMGKVQYGWPIGLPVCRPLGGGLWEVRSTISSRREARIVFCFFEGELVALHAFVKKSQKTPASDLDLARERQKGL